MMIEQYNPDLQQIKVSAAGNVHRSDASTVTTNTTGKPVENTSGITTVPVPVKPVVQEPVDVDKAIAKLNEIAEQQKKDVSFSVDKESDSTVIKVFNKQTGELIKQFPLEDILALKAKIRKSIGWLVDSRA